MLGVDPGTAILGYGVVNAGATGPARLVECGVVRTKASEALPVRLAIIFDGLSELFERHRPDAVAVEGLFHGRNARSALILGHARGVVLHIDVRLQQYLEPAGVRVLYRLDYRRVGRRALVDAGTDRIAGRARHIPGRYDGDVVGARTGQRRERSRRLVAGVLVFPPGRIIEATHLPVQGL